MRKSIKGQFTLLLVLLSLAPIAVIFAVYTPGMLKDLTSQAVQGLRASSKSQVRLTIQGIQGEIKEAELLAASPQVISYLRPVQGVSAGNSLGGQGFPVLYLFDKKGELRTSTGKEVALVLPYVDKEHFGKALQGIPYIYCSKCLCNDCSCVKCRERQKLLSDTSNPSETGGQSSIPGKEEASILAKEAQDRPKAGFASTCDETLANTPPLFISVPVFSAEKEVLGALVVGTDLHKVQSLLKGVFLPGSYSFLVGKDGNALACITSESILKTVGQRLVNPQTGLLTEGVKACLGGNEGFSPYAYTNHLGQKVLGAWDWVPGLEAGVILEVDAREVFRPISAVRGRLWWTLLIIGAGVAIAAVFTGRKLSEPLESLTSAVQKIAQGDLKERVYVQSQNEISEIADCINQIADSLQEKEVQLARVREKLVTHSLKDGLTGLFNRQHILQLLETEYKRARRYNLPLALLMVSLDNFKMVNDTYGYPFGDFVIKETARIFKDCVRDYDLLCRYGEEEFAIVLPNTTFEGAYNVAKKLRRTIAGLVFWQGDISTKLTITIGISTIAEQGINTKEDLLKHAEEALSEGKLRGRNTVVSWGELSTWEGFVHRVEKEIIDHYKGRFSAAANSMKRIYMEATMALVKSLEVKDGYTATHCYLVAMYAGCLAEALNLSEEEVEVIKNAAILHDIGKLSIPASLLSKPAVLTEEEYAMVKKHPEQAAKILDGVSFLQQEVPLILYHQEWYNGQGYPKGLKGEEIPLGARVLSICDTFEALTSPRPYRPNVSAERAFEMLRERAGTQFDPNLVEPFIKCMKELLATTSRMVVPQLNKTVEIATDKADGKEESQ